MIGNTELSFLMEMLAILTIISLNWQHLLRFSRNVGNSELI